MRNLVLNCYLLHFATTHPIYSKFCDNIPVTGGIPSMIVIDADIYWINLESDALVFDND